MDRVDADRAVRTWTEQVRAAEQALGVRLEAARGLEEALAGAQLEPRGRLRWAWMQRRRASERWERQDWTPRVRPNLLWALGLWAIGGWVLVCAGTPLVSVSPWLLLPVVLGSVAACVLGSWGLTWAAGRQVLVEERGVVALVQARPKLGGAAVFSVSGFDGYGPGLPLDAARVLSDEALAALAEGPARGEALDELRLAARLVQTRSAQLLASNVRIRGEARERGLVWWHELSESLDRAVALLDGPEQDRGLAALRYLLLRIGPEVDQALRARRFPELPPPADWASVGEARAPEELRRLGRSDA